MARAACLRNGTDAACDKAASRLPSAEKRSQDTLQQRRDKAVCAAIIGTDAAAGFAHRIRDAASEQQEQHKSDNQDVPDTKTEHRAPGTWSVHPYQFALGCTNIKAVRSSPRATPDSQGDGDKPENSPMQNRQAVVHGPPRPISLQDRPSARFEEGAAAEQVALAATAGHRQRVW